MLDLLISKAAYLGQQKAVLHDRKLVGKILLSHHT